MFDGQNHCWGLSTWLYRMGYDRNMQFIQSKKKILVYTCIMYVTLLSGTPWNIPWDTCSFSVYRQASRQVCIPRKYKWQVEYSMVYHKRALHNYILFFTQFMSRQNSTNLAIWLVPVAGRIFPSGPPQRAESVVLACGLGQHFQARGHSFSLNGPPSRPITCLCFFLR